MTKFLESILQTVGLEVLLETFKDNDFDDELLRQIPDCPAGSLEEHLFATLVPSIGNRLKIIGAIRKRTNSKSVTSSVQQISDGDQSSQEDNIVQYLVVTPPTATPPRQEENIFVDELQNIPVSPDCNVADPLFDVKRIILTSDADKGTTKGRKLLDDCVETNVINFALKNLIKRPTVNHLVKQYSYYPPKYVKENLAQCIAVQLFPSLPDSQKLDIINLFYSESKLSNSKREGSDGIIYRRIPASGLIEDRLKYIRRKNEVKCRVQPPNVESCQTKRRKSLGFSTLPSQVTKYMSETYCLRTSQFRNTNNLAEMLDQWPRLLDTPGMIELDFKTLFPGKCDKMLLKWAAVSVQICSYAEKIKTNLDEIGIKKPLSNWSKDDKTVGALVLLPYLTASSAYSKKSKKRKKITSGESAEFFIQVVPVTHDIENFRTIESRRKQPFVLCVGELGSLIIHDSYVMVETKLVKASSLIHAVDICFKMFHVLQLQFPDECYPVWCFFDHSIYQTKEIRSPPSAVLSLGSQITID
ncbi:uncharacterized protein LOC118437615 [Folsomia candida]|uniref:uncharacterized protein LOC118437615 n=1 Tax=Folsomia candida TaxID=158441 RepID=UPI001604E2A3|nr:uncharacterized protein LOC118437615 [Folsomia candida]